MPPRTALADFLANLIAGLIALVLMAAAAWYLYTTGVLTSLGIWPF